MSECLASFKVVSRGGFELLKPVVSLRVSAVVIMCNWTPSATIL